MLEKPMHRRGRRGKHERRPSANLGRVRRRGARAIV